jgi:hypothetical protein
MIPLSLDVVVKAAVPPTRRRPGGDPEETRRRPGGDPEETRPTRMIVGRRRDFKRNGRRCSRPLKDSAG